MSFEIDDSAPKKKQDTLQDELSTNAPIPIQVKRAMFFTCLGGVLFGYHTGIITIALPNLSDDLDLSNEQQESVVSFLYIGAIVGSACGGYFVDWAGRKKSIVITDLIFVAGAVLLSMAHTYTHVLVGRFYLGLGVAISGVCNVTYLTEISPPQHRGGIVSLNEACISFGLVLSYGLGSTISLLDFSDGSEAWRYMFGAGALISVVQGIGMLFMPESAEWLASKGFELEAQKVRIRLYGNDPKHVQGLPSIEEHELTLVLDGEGSADDTTSTSSSKHHEHDDKTEITATKISACGLLVLYHRQLFISFFLSAAQQFCGHINVLNFAPDLFLSISPTENEIVPFVVTIVLGLIKLIMTLHVIYRVDHYGRRFLLLWGIGTIVLSLVLFVCAFSGYIQSSLITNIFALMGAIGIVAGYASSFGPLTWLLTSEMFPPKIRGRVLGMSSVISNGSAALVTYTLFDGVRNQSDDDEERSVLSVTPFVGYLIVSLISWLFVLWVIPETGGGKTVDQIDSDLRNQKFWKCCCKCDNSRATTEVDIVHGEMT